MFRLIHRGPRPGPDWHAHGFTDKNLLVVDGVGLRRIQLRKQRWLHKVTGRTQHDRPVWDRPGALFALDVVVVVLAAWLLSDRGLDHVDWPWRGEAPCRRTARRWARHLRDHAADWLQRSRRNLIDYVAPRPLEELLPAGGVPPPRGARLRADRERVATASKLRDVVWLHTTTAQALHIPLWKLLVVARWRWPRNSPRQRPR